VTAIGEIKVTALVTMFKKIRFDTHETLGFGHVRLPETDMHTTAMWWTLPEDLAGKFTGDTLKNGMLAVANLLRMLTLPDEVTEMVRDGLLTAGHARVLAGLESREEQIRLAHLAAEEGMSVRRLEQLASTAKAKKPARKRKAVQLPAELNELQDKIRLKTGLKSTMTGSISKGKIVLQYSSREELERLNDMLDMIQE
jgi:hypothetical protein